jgi:apolipoprotein N-acyltransferase
MTLSVLIRAQLLLFGALALASSWLDARCFAGAWLGLLIFFYLISAQSLIWSSMSGLVYGMATVGVSFFWAPQMLAKTLAADEGDWLPVLVFTALIVWEAIPFALLGALASYSKQLILPTWMPAAAWVVLEWSWPRVFPWSLAHTQTDFRALVQLAELGGSAPISFLMVFAGLGAIISIERPRLWTTSHKVTFAACVGLILLFGYWRLWSVHRSMASAETMNIGVVQVDPAYVNSTQHMRVATNKLRGPLDLVLWPESSLGTYSTSVKSLGDIKRSLKIVREPFVDQTPAVGLGSWLLAGGKTYAANAKEKNSYFQTAYLIDPQGRFHARYHKRKLMPIGEYMPGEERFPSLHEFAQLSEYALSGDSAKPVEAGAGNSVGVLICYEEVIPEMARSTVANGAKVLVSLINASAFENDIALEQHLRLAILRTIENRRSLVRCAGTGISCWITPAGEIKNRLPVNQEVQFEAKIPLNSSLTVFDRVGHLLPQSCLIAIVFVMVSRIPNKSFEDAKPGVHTVATIV